MRGAFERKDRGTEDHLRIELEEECRLTRYRPLRNAMNYFDVHMSHFCRGHGVVITRFQLR